MTIDIENSNLFMMCTKLHKNAMTELPSEYHFRYIRSNELDIWKRMPFDDSDTAYKYYGYMNDWYERVYAPRSDLFFNACLFVCDADGFPVGTCFLWRAYGIVNTVHWFKVIKPHEGKGIGRALLSKLMKDAEYPVFLHTQPGSYRAIKLYSDFGFAFLLDPVIGGRKNDVNAALPFLKAHMPDSDYAKLAFTYAPESFLCIVSEHDAAEF